MSWVKRLFARGRVYGDLSAEIREHLEEKIEELVAEGMPRTEAEAKARKEFGNVTLMEERGREVWQWPRLESFIADVRYGLRMLRKSPGFTAVAVLTLALGIGANTAIFTLVDALYLKPLAVNHPEQIVRIYAAISGRSYNEGFSDPEFRLLREKASSFSALAAETQIAQLHVVVNGDSEELRGAFISANYFSLLGVGAQQGRTFLATEDGAPGGDAVAVVSNQFWKAHFGSDLAAIGAEIHINGIPFKIAGIAPPGFYGDIAGMPAQLWVPTSMLGACGYGCADGSYRCAVYDAIVGRLARGNSASGAQAELRGRIIWSATNWPQRPSLRRIIAAPANGVSPDQRAESDSQMRLLMAVTASLLLIACANLAGLLLARGAARKKEIALRLCIGASRTRVARQLFTESLLLAAGGGILGLWFSFGARNVLSGFYATDSEGFHHLYDLNFDWRILAYSMSIAILASVFFGLLPAIRAPRQDLVTELKDGASSGEFAGGWLRRGLVIAQVALSMTLVVSAGLLVRSGLAIERGTNFDPRHMAVLRLRPELIHYTPQQVASLVRRAMQAVETMPGVESAAFMEGGEGLVWNPQNGHEVPISVPGESQVTPAAGLRVQDVNSTFFETLRIPILQGRAFTEQDNAIAPMVAVVNQSLAHRLWPRESAEGQMLLAGGKSYQVIGVAANIQPESLLQAAEPHLYLSYWQSNATTNGDVRMAVRVAGDPSHELPRIRQTIQSVDPLVPIGEDMTMSEQVGLEYMPVLLGRSVMVFCGFLALILCAIGVYSILSFTVRMRTREIGIRIALGAQRRSVLRLVMGQGAKMALAGIVIGTVVALISVRLLSSLLFGVTSGDPATFLSVAALLVIVAVAACWIPARRAMRVDPMVALRYE